MNDPIEHNLHGILSNAVSTGELVSIIYHGGSQPGTIREIRAIKVSQTAVWAYDDTVKHDGTEQAKQFLLSKIEIPSKNAGAIPTYDPNAITIEDSHTIREIFEPKIDQFQAMGWYVELSENEIALHYYFKNGKVRKAAAIVLRFDEFITDLVFDEDKWIAGIKDGNSDFAEEKRKSKRPYHVVSPAYQGSGFAKLSHALEVFLAESERHKPAVSLSGDESAKP
jgi:hypothetical protein